MLSGGSARKANKDSRSETLQRINLITDSEYCVRLFGNSSIKARWNKPLIHLPAPPSAVQLLNRRAHRSIHTRCPRQSTGFYRYSAWLLQPFSKQTFPAHSTSTPSGTH